MKYSVHSPDRHSVTIDRKSDLGKEFEITVGKNTYSVEIRKVQEDGTLKTLMINHRVCPVEVERRGDGLPVRVFLKGVPYEVDISRLASARVRPTLPEPEVSGEVRANLPGQIIEILVKEGQPVSAGTPLVILDAMKMENELLAPKDGTIKSVAVQAGRILAKGDLILEVG